MRGHLQVVNGADAASRGSAESPIRVILAEEHGRMRRSLRGVLDAEPGIQVVAEARHRLTATQQVRTDRPAVLVLDLGLVGPGSHQAAAPAGAWDPDRRHNVHEIPAFAQHALGAGAAGFVLKGRSGTELVEAVRSAARGERYVSGGHSPDRFRI